MACVKTCGNSRHELDTLWTKRQYHHFCKILKSVFLVILIFSHISAILYRIHFCDLPNPRCGTFSLFIYCTSACARIYLEELHKRC